MRFIYILYIHYQLYLFQKILSLTIDFNQRKSENSPVLPLQFVPNSSYPPWHSQKYEPFVLVQFAFKLHGHGLSTHSSTSENIKMRRNNIVQFSFS